MTSIFDPPAATRTFNAADWLAAIDGALAAPPPADDEPEIAGDDLVLDATPAPWAARGRLHRWHKAVLATVLLLALPVGLYLVGWASLELAGIGAAVMLLELAAWLILAWRYDRL